MQDSNSRRPTAVDDGSVPGGNVPVDHGAATGTSMRNLLCSSRWRWSEGIEAQETSIEQCRRRERAENRVRRGGLLPRRTRLDSPTMQHVENRKSCRPQGQLSADQWRPARSRRPEFSFSANVAASLQTGPEARGLKSRCHPGRPPHHPRPSIIRTPTAPLSLLLQKNGRSRSSHIPCPAALKHPLFQDISTAHTDQKER